MVSAQPVAGQVRLLYPTLRPGCWGGRWGRVGNWPIYYLGGTLRVPEGGVVALRLARDLHLDRLAEIGRRQGEVSAGCAANHLAAPVPLVCELHVASRFPCARANQQNLTHLGCAGDGRCDLADVTFADLAGLGGHLGLGAVVPRLRCPYLDSQLLAQIARSKGVGPSGCAANHLAAPVPLVCEGCARRYAHARRQDLADLSSSTGLLHRNGELALGDNPGRLRSLRHAVVPGFRAGQLDSDDGAEIGYRQLVLAAGGARNGCAITAPLPCRHSLG